MWMDSWVLNVPSELWSQTEGIPHRFRFFETQSRVVVLSSSNQSEREVQLKRCRRRDIPVLRRRGGGGTVVLGPGCVVLTAAFYVKELYINDRYFQLVNGLWMEALRTLGILGLSQRGISDIALNDRKVAGTSIFRKKNLLVYQGSLLVNPNVDHIASLLQHPSREPDYRSGRSHRDFVTTLSEAGFGWTAAQVVTHCEAWFRDVGVKKLVAFLRAEMPDSLSGAWLGPSHPLE